MPPSLIWMESCVRLSKKSTGFPDRETHAQHQTCTPSNQGLSFPCLHEELLDKTWAPVPAEAVEWTHGRVGHNATGYQPLPTGVYLWQRQSNNLPSAQAAYTRTEHFFSRPTIFLYLISVSLILFLKFQQQRENIYGKQKDTSNPESPCVYHMRSLIF